MACSAVTLSISTITAVLALACLSISFGTDNWLETRVNRTAIRQTLQKDTDEYRAYETRMEYFSRDTGLFRICFPEKKPKGLETFMSPVQTDCVNVNYYIPENEESDGFSEQRWERLRHANDVRTTAWLIVGRGGAQCENGGSSLKGQRGETFSIQQQ
ncbi:hypothetical protein HPB52_013124 [Rhipicephalus sanguineus]|uniref:Uncharacterized protein n=1 Tax=Rhipicephalus sanguineus TaxID=34632 RepID=A0A9D4SSK6_RHISA|nr:hypothetical protein HPB52_013124 [Rhipicephalus sanguineus]